MTHKDASITFDVNGCQHEYQQTAADHYQADRKALAKPNCRMPCTISAMLICLLARQRLCRTTILRRLRQRSREMKDRVRENQPRYREQFITNAEAAGATVYLAKTAADANNYIAELAKEQAASRLAVKSKSMASEETHLNIALEKAGSQGTGDRSRRMDHPAGRAAAEPHGDAGDPHVQGRGRRTVQQGDRKNRAGRNCPSGAGRPRAVAAGLSGCRHGHHRRQHRCRRNRRHRAWSPTKATPGSPRPCRRSMSPWSVSRNWCRPWKMRPRSSACCRRTPPASR